MNTLLQDIRYGLRMLGKSPAFTAIAILTLALGIGANTAIFSFTDQVLLRNLPVPNPEQLAVLRSPGPNPGRTWSDGDGAESFSYPMYKDLRDRSSVFSGLLACFPVDVNVSGRGATQNAHGELVTGNFFETLEVQPALGRVFMASDETAPGANPVVVLSYGYWTRQFGADLSILNKSLTVNGVSLTVVGVARDVPGLRITDVKDAGVFLPTGLDVAKTSIVARVQGEPNLARQALVDRLARVDPNIGMIITMRTVARLETLFLQIAFSVSVMLGGLALLLTVSGLFSVLSYLVEQRTREIGVRMALGASGLAVTRLMLAQTIRPVMAGLIAGAGLAAALAAALLATPAGALISPIVHVTDPVAYLASLGVIVAACLSAAWIPAARAAKVDPMRTLRQE